MGFGFSKSFSLGGGVRLNVSKRGLGISAGIPGFRVGVGPSGTRVTASIPGTGISYTQRLSSRSARASRQQQAAIRRQLRELEKLEKLRRNQLEVEEFEKTIEMLKSVHTECSKPIDWHKEASAPPPFEPGSMGPNEWSAVSRLKEYRPSFFDRLLKKEEQKRQELQQAVEEGKKKDQEDLEQWRARVELAKRVLDYDTEAYVLVLQNENPFDDIAELGSELDLVIDKNLVEVSFHAKSKEVIPQEEKSLTSKGNLSIKKMSKTKMYDIYQDYVCSCAIRIGREFFALLPVDYVLVHVEGDFLDTATGKEYEETILSVKFPREDFLNINFDRIDCSDCVSSFPHRMKFLKTKGFQPVERLSY